MNIKVNNKYLDLYQDTGATIKFQIQVSKDVTKRIVSTTDTFNIPATDENKAIIDPQITGKSKYTDVVIEFENGFNFVATLYISTSTEYVLGEEYSIKLVSDLAEKLNSIGKDGIESLFTASDNFKYIFMDDVQYNVQTDPTTNWFFLTASNRNGVDYDDSDNFPTYADKFIDKDRQNGQLFITSSIYAFFKHVFDTYGVSYEINATDILMPGVTINDVYIFIPVKLQSLNPRSFSFDVTITPVSGAENQNELVIDTDGQYHLGLQPNKVTATTDTKFKISASGTIDIKFIHTYRYGGILTDVDFVSGYVTTYINIYKDDVLFNRVKICEFGDSPDSVAQPNATDYVQITLSDYFENVESLATTEFTFNIGFVFSKYNFNYDINLSGVRTTVNETLDGEYSAMTDSGQAELSFNIDINGTPGFPISFDSTDNISPCTRKDGSYDDIDDIDMITTMKLTKLKTKDIINDILVRFNAGFYLDSNDNMKFGTFSNRYNTSNKIKITSWENGYNRQYNQDTLGVFDYKNKKDNRNYGTYEKSDGTIRVIGDVDEQNFNGDKDEKIYLKSSYVDRNLYNKNKHDVTDSETELINYKDSTGRIYGKEWCGVPTNEPLKNNELVLLIGFLGEKTVDNIYIPFVDMVELPTEGNLPTVTYLHNSNIPAGDLIGNPIKLYYPTKESVPLSANLYLGDETNHEVDNTTKLYNNFIPVLNPYDNYITINTIIDINILNNILDGYIITLLYGDGTEQDYYPLEISGISLETKYSIAEIKMIKKV